MNYDPSNPLIVQGIARSWLKLTIRAMRRRAMPCPVADLEKSPEHIHTYV